MKEFKNEIEADRKAMNKQWGDLANKMGTLVEDIISPAVRPVVTKYFDCDITSFMPNVRKKDKSLNLNGEFDVIAVSDEYVFLVEAKSSPKKQYLYEFIENRLFGILQGSHLTDKINPISIYYNNHPLYIYRFISKYGNGSSDDTFSDL